MRPVTRCPREGRSCRGSRSRHCWGVLKDASLLKHEALGAHPFLEHGVERSTSLPGGVREDPHRPGGDLTGLRRRPKDFRAELKLLLPEAS